MILFLSLKLDLRLHKAVWTNMLLFNFSVYNTSMPINITVLIPYGYVNQRIEEKGEKNPSIFDPLSCFC